MREKENTFLIRRLKGFKKMGFGWERWSTVTARWLATFGISFEKEKREF